MNDGGRANLRRQGKDKEADRGTSRTRAVQEAVPTEPPEIAGPGSKKRRGEEPKDEVRAMLLERIRERGLTVADISRALKKNDAYMHQFIWRASPEWLKEADRAVVCRLLDIPEALLRPPMPDFVPSIRGVQPAMSAGAMDQRNVPLFREDDEINFASASEWAYRLPGLAPGPVFALWIAREHGRFGPGDQIFIHQRQPPRIGDHVVAVAERRVVAIGRLENIDDGGMRVQGVGKQGVTVPAGVNSFKVAAAIYA